MSFEQGDQSKKSNKKKNVELLKKRFGLDEDNKVFDIRLKLDNLDQLIDKSISTEKNPVLNEDADGFLLHYLRDIPSGYKCNMTLQIADYQGYSQEAVMDAFKDSLNLNLIRFKKEDKRKKLLVFIMTIAGLILVVLSKTAFSSLFKNPTANAIVVETLDIAGWVFLWEAVTVLFLNPSEILRKGLYLLRLKSFNLE